MSVLAISLRFYQTQLALFPHCVELVTAQSEKARRIASILIAKGC